MSTKKVARNSKIPECPLLTFKYCSLSQLVAHFQIFRRLMKGKFDAYVRYCDLWQKSFKIE